MRNAVNITVASLIDSYHGNALLSNSFAVGPAWVGVSVKVSQLTLPSTHGHSPASYLPLLLHTSIAIVTRFSKNMNCASV